MTYYLDSQYYLIIGFILGWPILPIITFEGREKSVELEVAHGLLKKVKYWFKTREIDS
jgi:hypothetical protein